MRSHVLQRLVMLVVLLAFTLFVGGCATDRQVISQAQDLHTGLQPAVLTDAQLDAYIQKIGNRIVDVAQELHQQHQGPDAHFSEDSAWMFTNRMKFHFVASDELNAFTTGGEHMYVYTQLFRECKTEDELAAVMAHEYAHVYCRHVQKGMNRQYALLGASAVAGGAGYALAGKDNKLENAATFASAAAVAGQFVGMGFTRGDEAEADKWGFIFYTHAGWDPNHFGDFFQHMIDKGYDKTPEMMSDHPSLASRVQVAKQSAAALPANARNWKQPPVADAAAFAALQQRATALAKSLPADKSLQSAKLLLASFPSCVSPTETPTQKNAQSQLTQYLNQQKQPKKAK